MTPFKKQRRFRVTIGGLAFLAITALLTLGALNAGLNTVYLLACLLICACLAGTLGPLWNMGGVDVRRARCEDAYAGEPFNADLWVFSRRRTGAHMLFVEEPLGKTENGGGKSARKLIQSVKPGERVRVSCRVGGRPRGVHPLPELTLGSRFPFGMAERRFSRSSGGELLVFPARGRLAEEVASAILPKGLREGRPARRGLPAVEFRSVRDYRPGDSPRAVHWRATAHRGELVVKELERQRSAPAILILDSRIPRSTPPDRRPMTGEALELAVSFAAEACRAAVNRGEAIRLLAFHPEPRILHVGAAGAGRAMDLRGLLEALARLKPSDSEDASALTALLQEEEARAVSRIAAVTPTPETASGIRAQLAGRPARIYVASDPDMASRFRLLRPEERAP